MNLKTGARIALVAAVLAALWAYGRHEYDAGATAERAVWQQKEGALLSETAKAAFRDSENKLREQQNNEAIARKVSQSHAKEIAAIHAEYDRHARYGLRLPGSVCGDVAARPEAASPGAPDGALAGTIALPEPIASDLWRLTRDADKVTATCRGLQQFAIEHGFYPEPTP